MMCFWNENAWGLLYFWNDFSEIFRKLFHIMEVLREFFHILYFFIKTTKDILPNTEQSLQTWK